MPEGFNLKENCGLCVAHSLHDIYSFIKSLQHRGREATGIAFIGNKRIDVIKWVGKVEMFDLEDLYKIFNINEYHTFFAHVRYATRGRKDKILEDAHPHTIGGIEERRGGHTIIRDCDLVGVHNGQINPEFFSKIDKTQLKTGCDTEALLHYFKDNGERGILKNIPGSYTLAIASKDRKDVIILRDRFGLKPGILGWKDGKYCMASEDCFFREKGVSYKKDIDPGCVYYFSPEGDYTKEEVITSTPKYCFFEYNYVSSVDSIINGVPVRKVREFLGEELAKEFKIDADLVTFLPRCPEFAAMAYSQKTKIPFAHVFYKPRGERAFLGSTPEERKTSIQDNLYLIPETFDTSSKTFLKDKTIILIDDSTIRGNNSKRAIEVLKNAGVKKIYLLNYTPKIGLIGEDGIKRGCLYGVDMPPEDNFVVRDSVQERNREDSEISEQIGAEVHFLSVNGMFNAFEKAGLPRDHFCSFCIGGEKII